MTINPRAGHPALEVELRDGSGAVTLVWLGRRQIPGIDCGRTLKVWGRISCHEGRRLVYNPRLTRQMPALLVIGPRCLAHDRAASGAEDGFGGGQISGGGRAATVPLRGGVRPLPARSVSGWCPRHDRVCAAVRCLHHRLGRRPAALSGRAAGGTALVLAAIRLLQRQSLKYVAQAIIPTAIAVLVATRTGRAQDVFLPGILYNGALAVISW